MHWWWGLWLACTGGEGIEVGAEAPTEPTGAMSTEATADSGDVGTGRPTTSSPPEPTTEPPPCTDPPEVLTFTEPGARWDQGDPATLVHGPQGGWHIGMTGRIHGPRDLDVTLGADWIDEGVQLGGADNTFRFRLSSYDDAACEGSLIGALTYLDDPPGVDQAYICSLEGERLLVWMDVVDPVSGRSDRVELEVVAALDPSDDRSAYAAKG